MRVIAVGTRMPGWVDEACEDYRRRLRPPWRLTLTELPAVRRADGADAAARARLAEGRQILAQLSERERVVPLDEQGNELSTAELAAWLRAQQASGVELTFIIGGADGLDAAVLARGERRWSLSRLTLPHGLARVLLMEQLYRAASLLGGHPYHRA
ncbi:MAG TPA: 23S rRNA (pseudouridine(1915)-N(3))-methyltransferase RlmH [Steroidobacteraceae bacterium]|nr:23S rRNA (pseudouridine(1915)-N(3))-methyltransferase RlmH [Steroidobacteraceae bacterium]